MIDKIICFLAGHKIKAPWHLPDGKKFGYCSRCGEFKSVE